METQETTTQIAEPTFEFEFSQYGRKDILKYNVDLTVTTGIEILHFVAQPPNHDNWQLTNRNQNLNVTLLVKIVPMIPEKFKAAAEAHKYQIEQAEEIEQAKRVKVQEEKKAKLDAFMKESLAQLKTKIGPNYLVKLGENEHINIWNKDGQYGTSIMWNSWDEKWEIYHNSIGTYSRRGGRSGTKKSKNLLSLVKTIQDVIAYNQRTTEGAEKLKNYAEKLLAAMTKLGYVVHPRTTWEPYATSWMKAGADEKKDPCFAKHYVKLDETGNVVVTSTSLTYNTPTILE